MADQKFPEGIRFFDKHPSQPDFVKGAVIISINELVKFCKENADLLTDYKGEKQLKLQQLESSNGKTYFAVDTYKKDANAPAKPAKTQPAKAQAAATVSTDDDLPF